MKTFSKAMLGAVMFAGVSLASAMPALAQVDVGIAFGDPETNFDPCDYYDYYDEAPPWGLPDDYCEYPVYYEPVFFDGYWYRGPIYYRWTHGRRLFWLNGGWRADGWRGGSRPGRITWSNRGNHFRGGSWRGRDWRGGVGHRSHDDDRDRGDRHPWTGKNGNDRERSWVGAPPRDRDGGGHNDNGNRDRHPWTGSGHDGGGHSDRGGWGSDHGGDHGNWGGHSGDHDGGGHSDRGNWGGHSDDHGGGSHFGGGFGGNHSGGGGGHRH